MTTEVHTNYDQIKLGQNHRWIVFWVTRFTHHTRLCANTHTHIHTTKHIQPTHLHTHKQVITTYRCCAREQNSLITHACARTHTHTHTHTHTYTHTHTHTHTH